MNQIMIVKNVVFCSVNVQHNVACLSEFLCNSLCLNCYRVVRVSVVKIYCTVFVNKECCIFCIWNVIRVLKNDLLLPLYKYFLTFLLGMKTLKLNI
jgi:hypothetical protein